ncbi:MAG: TatD family hydrolase [Candidatus Pacebacteria bacterium]|nr:TatD family hydrolase [Candidatus Paceibacterota bacterium]
MKYFDAHCHIQFPQYDEDRAELLASMQEAEVGGLIVGTDSTLSKGAVELADGKTLFAAVGLHPNDKPKEGYDDGYYRKLAEDPNVVAIGECGLDYFRPEEPENEKARQKEVFDKHIQLALDTDKPLMIHARPSKGSMDAYLDAIDMLKGKNVRGNMHFYVGDVETTQKFLELGFTFSFTAVLTFTHDYDEVVKYLPLENILSETDAPYVAPAPNRGKRNDPLAVREVVKAVASIRGEDEEVVREALLGNAIRAFRLPTA